MSEKRRDKRNRILHNGETQRPDGRYCYRYKSSDGTYRYIYSWKLDKNDRMPKGVKNDLSLREKERLLQQDAFRESSLHRNKNMTVLQLVEKYVQTKNGVRASTVTGYNTVINFLKNDPFGQQKITDVKTSDAKIWLVTLQTIEHKRFSSIQSIRGVLRPAFKMALDDDLILKNPFDFELTSVVINDSVTREAITRNQQRKFLTFVKEDSHFSRYYEGIYILFNTGLRISEFTGLTFKDINFEEHYINVDHQLCRGIDMKMYIQEPKTGKGVRKIPMTKELEEMFLKIIGNRQDPEIEPVVDGYSGFLYLDKNEQPMVALHWEKYFEHIVEKYNKIYKEELPKITPHVCRHTFCSNMAKSGMNPKSLQYLMGHADINITFDVYTHIQYEDARDEMERVMSLETNIRTS